MVGGPTLLERDEQLAAMDQAWTDALGGQGRLILLVGEAGVGKTTLVRQFSARVPNAEVITGLCDPLPTPPALGPLMDMAPRLGSAFEELVDSGRSGRALFAAILSLFRARREPLVVIFEDMHWADQASLDLVGFLGRRIEQLRMLLILTFREDEIATGGPPALLLGSLAGVPGVVRLRLEPLSREATVRLAQDGPLDPRDVYERTGGNPFFISELLRSNSLEIPSTVRDAILTRLRRLSPEALQAVQTAAAIGLRVDQSLLASVLNAMLIPRWTIQEAINAGLLQFQMDIGPQSHTLAFRHALAQAAIAGAIPPELAQRLHRTILAELRGSPVRADDYALLTAHAEAAADDAAVLELAPQAAARAAVLGAHREAAQLYGKAVERAPQLPQASAELLEARGVQHYLSGQLARATDDHRLAARLYQALGDGSSEGRNLIRFSYLKLAAGDRLESASALEAATALLEQLPVSRELASAYEARARRLFVSNEPNDAAIWAERSYVVAEQLGDTDLSLDAGVTLEASRLISGDTGARQRLEKIRDAVGELTSADARARDSYARAAFYLAFLPMLRRRYEDIDRYQEEAGRYYDENELEYWDGMLMGARVLRALDGGQWRNAVQLAQAVLDSPNPAWRSKLLALVALARVKARTGQPDAAVYLDQATEVATEDPAVAGMIWPTRVEAAWLRGDSELALHEATDQNTGRLRGTGDSWFDAEMLFWLQLAGEVVDANAIDVEPYRLAVAGDWHAAARWWEEQGCPYEMAVVLATADQAEAVRRAISLFDQLGAGTPAAYARRRLRALGVDSVPRGPRRSTTANAAGLTVRELEVLQLVAAGLSNAEVATRLFLSAKTVERHMAGIFAKLQVTSRREAVQVAARIGAITSAQN